jgi:hypothetical protein
MQSINRERSIDTCQYQVRVRPLLHETAMVNRVGIAGV